MPGPRHETGARGTRTPRQDRRTASTRTAAPNGGGEGPPGRPEPSGTGNGERRGRADRGASAKPDTALHGLLRGLFAGDLESVLLTVAMAADDNRMPSADPDEAARILDFLVRLARYDAVLPPCPGGAGVAPEGPSGTR